MTFLDIFVDPGTAKTGVALYGAGPIPAVCLVKNCKAGDARALLEWGLANYDEVRLYVEDQHVTTFTNPSGKEVINWPSLQALVLAADRWIVIAEDLGIPSEKIRPGKAGWQGSMFKSIPKRDAQGKNRSTKQLAQLVVVKSWTTVRRFTDLANPSASMAEIPAAKVTQDQADAAVMGRWKRLFGG